MDKKYYITLDDGTQVPVSEDIYHAYYRSKWREAKRRKVRADTEFSYEFMVEKAIEGNITSVQLLTDEIIEDKLLLEMLMKALENLTGDERGLIDALYFKDKTEREVADELSKSKTSIHAKKERILKKLHNFMKNFNL